MADLIKPFRKKFLMFYSKVPYVSSKSSLCFRAKYKELSLPVTVSSARYASLYLLKHGGV